MRNEQAASSRLALFAGALQIEMATVKDFGSIAFANTFSDDPKKRKKKKAKKPKKEKSDNPKSKAKGQPSSKDFTDICDSNLFADWLKIKRKEKPEKKENPDVRSNEAFPLTQKKNLKLSRQHKQNRKGERAPVERGVCSGPGEQEAPQPIISSVQKEKKQKKRVVFNLSPVLLEPEPVQDPRVAKDGLRPQHKKPPLNAVFPAGGRHGKPAAEANGTESQSTSDDINSQDLFITQKTFLDPYIDLCSSASAEEVGEPQGYTETSPKAQSNAETSATEKASPGPPAYAESSPWTPSCPKHQASMASWAKKRSSPAPRCPEPQSHLASSRMRLCPEHQFYIASSARKRSSPEPLSHPASSSSSRKRFCSEHQSYTQSYPGPQASTASSPWKQPSPKPQCFTASRPEPRSLPKKPSCPSSPPRKPSRCHKLDVFTQTENFFTSPLLATSVRFRQRSPCPEEPLDLSLPRRSRLRQDAAVSNVLGDHHHAEPNVTDPTAGYDSDSHSKSKADLSQLKTVQTRLNESFFFKLKGEGDSPKPVSPLMKLTGSAEKKKP